MMLDELRLLLAHTGPNTFGKDFLEAILTRNLLGKPTSKARELTHRHLRMLYGFDSANPIFRALCRLWPLSEGAQPMLALVGCPWHVTRSFFQPRARSSQPRVRPERRGHLDGGRLPVTATAQDPLQPPAHPESVTLLLFLGYLEGRTGQRLFSSDWMSLLGGSPDELEALANSASHRGLLVFMNAGGVKEVRFPGYLTPEEERIRQEVSHVV
jgi:hypothetical protein